MTTLLIITNIILYISLIGSLGIMIPQIIAMYKNKYADNSSIFTYAIYLGYSLICVVYQIVFFIYNEELAHSKGHQVEPGLVALLYVQLLSDALSTVIGVWLMILKYHYVRVGNIKKNTHVERDIKRREKNLLFLKNLEPFLNEELSLLCTLYGKDIKRYNPKDSCELIKVITNIYHHRFKKTDELPHDLKTREDIWSNFLTKLYHHNKAIFVECIPLTIKDRIYLRKNKRIDLFTYYYKHSTTVSKMAVACRVMQAFKE